VLVTNGPIAPFCVTLLLNYNWRKPAVVHPMIRMASICLLLQTSTVAAQVGEVVFDGTWKEQGFPWFSANTYVQKGARLDVLSRGTVSILYKRFEEAAWPTRAARWTWGVQEGVPATDLSVKGGDDRNLALYFVFADVAVAPKLERRSLRRILSEPAVRVLVYVRGGQSPVGSVLPSPYLDSRGVTIIARPVGTGRFNENMPLKQDLQKAFGVGEFVLVGVAVSSDSDDTDTGVIGYIESLSLQ
jgi:hypothetical protein